MMTRQLASCLLVAATLVTATACSKSSDGDKADAKAGAVKQPAKKSVTIGIAQEPDTLNMIFKEMMAAEEVARAGMYTLTMFDADWNLVPWAAKEIPTLENGGLEIFEENGQKKMRATWVIRDEFVWSDGKPLVGDDFLFTHNVIMDPTQEVIDRSTDQKIEKMEVQGDDRKTLVVTWREPYAYYSNYRQHEALPKHILEPVYRRDPGALKKHPFGTKPALAGAFYIHEWVPGSHIIAKKNPHAKGFLEPKLDEIIWRIIPQTNTLEANVLSGTIDAISTLGLSFDQGLELEKRIDKSKFEVEFIEGLVWEHIDFNLDNEILKDKRVRQALAYGADRAGIANALFEDRQPVAHGTEPPRSPYFNANVKKYPFDPAKAKALLDEAGWKEPAGGGVREKGGKKLQLVIMTTSGNKTREQVEVLLQSQWREIGIDIQIRNEPAKVFFGETMRHRKYEHMAMYAWNKDPVTVSETLWSCENIPSAKNAYQGQNQPGFCDPKVDDLLKAAALELDPEKRALLGQEVEAILAEELPALPLFFRVDVSVRNKQLQNWKPTGTLQPVTWNAHEWHWN